MNKTLLLLLFFIFAHNCFSQDFLEVKFSINDIKLQRENFVKEKIKSVTVKDKYSERVFAIDEQGKILSETGKGDNPYLITYSYKNENLTGFSGPFEHSTFEYDKNGNVKKSDSDEIIYYYYYNSQNNLIKEDATAEIEVCPANKFKYDGNLKTIIEYPCCEGNIAQRCSFKYDSQNKLINVIWDEITCSDKKVHPVSSDEYFYNDNTVLPNKLIRLMRGETEEIFFTYENY